jgi:hypothetical protein
VGGLGRERTGSGQAIQRVMLVFFHLVRMDKVLEKDFKLA